ncbi:MAG: prepilin-type N-terminal cleavage/methylation domain-containing protein, partial [Planctomycetota bacterium]
MKAKANKAFTLIEVLIGAALSAMLLAAVAVAL